jgi:RNA polymerase sigma-70 factor (ECF subfamily)
MAEPDIERSIERVKAGILDDYRFIVGAYHERLRRILSDWCPPGIEAEEVALFAFGEAYRQLARYEPGTNFFAWLCAIARNRLLAECEAWRRRTRNEENYLNYLITQEMHRSLASETSLDDTRDRFLDDCLQRLQPDARELIEQRYRQVSPVAELAAKVGRSATAVSVQLFAIRRKLRECIEAKWRFERAR